MPLLTLEEWDALPEDSSRHYELAKGVLVASPLGGPHHRTAKANLTVTINRQLPQTLAAIPNVIVSPGSRTTDRVSKLAEYAQAGIPHYWVIEPATLIAYKLVDGRYEIVAKATGKVTLVEPATVTFDVSRLTEPRY